MTSKTFMAIIMFTFILFFSSIGNASHISLDIKAGTLGAGLEVEGTFTDSIGARIGLNYFSYDYSGTEDDIEYEFDLTLETVSLLLDWHPFKGSFRISGGAMYNGNEVNAEAVPSDTYEIGDTTYSAADIGTLDGVIDFNEIAPYFGLGFDTSYGKANRIGFVFELGAIYQGSPNVDLSASGPIASDQTFQDNLNKEEDNIQRELDNFKFYPVIAIGISYRL